ncbi:replication protein P [Marinomonas sp. 15G1-11]|uniref:Replication protein P n=1 Tax=Marinomonas phaeophyticola TaxID=3004091 RepID=A0ABT4JXX1_9GAMM|nr:replication protein P [Marinomonas sp. 15G1-11]MCZ2723232.1 replication protein P [Marinomonas sp. 15G1-11]
MHSPISTTQTGNEQESSHQSDEQNQQNRMLVNMLFARFKAIYTHKFASAYSTPDEVKLAKREWSIAIRGFQEPLLAYAVERAKETYAWPPTISEFLNLINTAYKVYGLVNPRSAYMEACRCRMNPLEFRWSHPAIYFAGSKVGWYFLRTEEERKTWPEFDKAYLEQVQKVIEGKQLTIPKVQQIENKQEDLMITFIPKLVAETGLSESKVAALLYYTKKTEGTAVRANYRMKTMKELAVLGFDIDLPS